jgi:hypothetical protein
MTTHPDWSDNFQDDIQCPHCGKLDSEHTDYPHHELKHDGDRPGCSWADNPWVIARIFTVEAACAPPK